MLLRFFMNLYDMEVVEEEAFLKWKEEVNDQYPGKGKALFQVMLQGPANGSEIPLCLCVGKLVVRHQALKN